MISLPRVHTCLNKGLGGWSKVSEAEVANYRSVSPI